MLFMTKSSLGNMSFLTEFDTLLGDNVNPLTGWNINDLNTFHKSLTIQRHYLSVNVVRTLSPTYDSLVTNCATNPTTNFYTMT